MIFDTTTVDTTNLPWILREADSALNEGRKEVVFVDTGVADWQVLADGIRDGVEVVLVDASQSGLAQMAEWAQSRFGYDAIHVLSHGSDGSLLLGSEILDNVSLNDATVRAELARLGQALTAEGDLLLYGCNVAADAEGQAFVAKLVAATGADVAASSDATGSAERGGDWELEYVVGVQEARSDAVIASRDFAGVLGYTEGTETLVNTYTTSDQLGQSVTALSGGGYIVTWNSSGQDGSGYGVYGQIYDANGVASGDEFRVNTYTTDIQGSPSVAALSGGGFVVTWQSSGQDGDRNGVYGQIYDANGTTSGSEFKVNTYTTSYQQSPTVTALSGGGFVVTWQSTGQDGDSTGVYGQIYDANGTTSGSEFKVNTYTTGDQTSQTVTTLSGGGFVVTWQSYGQDGDSTGVYGQIYAANGTTSGSEFKVNTYTTGDQTEQTVTALSDGGFVVTWASYGQDGDGNGVYGQIYAANGTTSGSEFKLNTYTTGDQDKQTVTALSDGGFVVTWTSYGQDGDGNGVYGQIYAANGTAVGSEFLVNTHTTGHQSESRVTALSDGGFVVTWTSSPADIWINPFVQIPGASQDGDGDGVYGQIYDASGTAVGSEFQVNTYTTDSQNGSTVTALSGGGFAVTWASDYQDGDARGIYQKLYVSDTLAPSLNAAASSPANGAVQVMVGANLTLAFSEGVSFGTDGATIRVVEDGSGTAVATFTVGTDTTSGAGTTPAAGQAAIDTATPTRVVLNPSADLGQNTRYRIEIDAGALTDTAGNAIAAVGDNVLEFTTENPNALLTEAAGFNTAAADGDSNGIADANNNLLNDRVATNADNTVIVTNFAHLTGSTIDGLGGTDTVVLASDGLLADLTTAASVQNMEALAITGTGSVTVKVDSAKGFNDFITWTGRAGEVDVLQTAENTIDLVGHTFTNWDTFDNTTSSNTTTLTVDSTVFGELSSFRFGLLSGDKLTGNLATADLTGKTFTDLEIFETTATGTVTVTVNQTVLNTLTTIAATQVGATATITTADATLDLSAETLTLIDALATTNGSGTTFTVTAAQAEGHDFTGAAGTDRITLSAAGTVDFSDRTLIGIEALHGANGGANTLTGTAGAETIVGGDQADNLTGGAGADTLIGGNGTDTLTGDAGTDTFKGSATELSGDTIADLALGDAVHLTGVTGLSLSRVRINGSNLEIDDDKDGFGGNDVSIVLTSVPTGIYFQVADIAGTDTLITLIDAAPPVFAGATVNGSSLIMTYTEQGTLDATNIPLAAAFTVMNGATPITVTGVAVNAANKTVTLTLASAVASGDSVTVAYTDPTAEDDANAIQDAVGNDAATLTATVVTNNTPAPASGGDPAPTPAPTNDDHDGIDAAIEAQVPALPSADGQTVAGDGNGDGIADTEQPEVTSVPFLHTPTAVSNPGAALPVFITLVANTPVDAGTTDAPAQLTGVSQLDAPADKPSDLDMPFGLISFTATASNNGSTENFSLFVDGNVAVNGYWKQSSGGAWVNLASHIEEVGDKLRLDFSITDGGPFDADGQADGVITDPGAFGFGERPVPTLTDSIIGLYVAYYDRAPDQAGLQYWQAQARAGLSLANISAGFAEHPRFAQEYDGLSPVQIAHKLYQNVLHRSGDAGGITYWADQLDQRPLSDVMVDFVQTSLTVDLDALQINSQINDSEYSVAFERQKTLDHLLLASRNFIDLFGADTVPQVSPDQLGTDPAYQAAIEVLANIDNNLASVDNQYAQLLTLVGQTNPMTEILALV